jgi:hypothetical protein
VLKRTYEIKWDEVTGEWRKLKIIMRGFIIYRLLRKRGGIRKKTLEYKNVTQVEEKLLKRSGHIKRVDKTRITRE